MQMGSSSIQNGSQHLTDLVRLLYNLGVFTHTLYGEKISFDNFLT